MLLLLTRSPSEVHDVQRSKKVFWGKETTRFELDLPLSLPLILYMFIFKKKKINEDRVIPDDALTCKSEKRKTPFPTLPTTRLISERLLNAVVDKTTITAAALSGPSATNQDGIPCSAKSYILSSSKYVRHICW